MESPSVFVERDNASTVAGDYGVYSGHIGRFTGCDQPGNGNIRRIMGSTLSLADDRYSLPDR